MSGSMSLIVVVFVIILGIFVFYEKKKVSIKHISVIASLSAIAGMSRVPFAVLPNIQPATFLIIMSGYVFGPVLGFMVGAVSVLVSNSVLGHGPWTLWQIAAWGFAGFSAGLFGKLNIKLNRIILAVFAFVWGFLFGWIMNLWHWITFIYPLSFKTFMSVCAMSFYFDCLHALGNFIFTFMFGKDLAGVLYRVRNKAGLCAKIECLSDTK